MKKEDLFSAIGEADDYYLKECEKSNAAYKPPGIGRTLIYAASLVVIFGAMLILPNLLFGGQWGGPTHGDTFTSDSADDTTTPQSLSDHPTDKEVIAAYEAASEAADWFRLSSLGSLYGSKSDYIVIDGQPYWRVEKFETYDEFDAYLRSLFSDTLVGKLMDATSAYSERDGKLYSAPADAGSNIAVSEGRIKDIVIEDETTITVLVTMDVYDYADRLDPTPRGDIIGEETAVFTYSRIDGKWVFTDFPDIGQTSLSDYQGYAMKNHPSEYEILTFRNVKIPFVFEHLCYEYISIFEDKENAFVSICFTPELLYGNYGDGKILDLYRFSAGEYERNVLAGNIVGNMTALATDGEYYYAMSVPTDVTDDPNNSTFSQVSGLARETIKGLFAEVNGFEPLDASEFYDREFTYDGEHKFVRYYPYGKGTELFYTIVLSQPAKQGEGGIWCVERWYSMSKVISTPLAEEQPSDAVTVISGNIHIVFPDSGDLSAIEYYAECQEMYDLSSAVRRDPMSVALDWAKSVFGDNVTADKLEYADGLPEGQYVY